MVGSISTRKLWEIPKMTRNARAGKQTLVSNVMDFKNKHENKIQSEHHDRNDEYGFCTQSTWSNQPFSAPKMHFGAPSVRNHEDLLVKGEHKTNQKGTEHKLWGLLSSTRSFWEIWKYHPGELEQINLISWDGLGKLLSFSVTGELQNLLRLLPLLLLVFLSKLSH